MSPRGRSGVRAFARAATLALLVLAGARAGAEERIVVFGADVTVLSNGDVRVVESIRYDFGAAVRHGIYRNIPVVSSGGRVTLEVEAVRIDGDGVPFRARRSGGEVEIRIGDPDRTVTGEHVYEITYLVDGALRTFDGRMELYWNVTGEDWEVPIQASKATVRIPGSDEPELRCMAGASGSTGPCGARATPGQARFASGRLPSGHGMTVVVGFDPQLVSEPVGWEAFVRAVRRHAHWVPSAVTLVGLLALWFVFGRDPRDRRSVVVQYRPPPGMSPAQASVVWDERSGRDVVAATIIDLAARGRIRIVEEDGTHRLVKQPAADDETDPVAREILDGLFSRGSTGVRLDGTRSRFHEAVARAHVAAYRQAVALGAFGSSPKSVRGAFVALGLAACLAGLVVLLVRGGSGLGLGRVVAMFVPGLLVVAASRAMPRRTRAGVALRRHLRGLHEFIERVDGDALAKVDADLLRAFETNLPFAMVLGAADRWVDAFEGRLERPPSWYGARSGRFDPTEFRTGLHSFERGLVALAQPPVASTSGGGGGGGGSGFSSGGSVGGGFGGGGGRSW